MPYCAPSKVFCQIRDLIFFTVADACIHSFYSLVVFCPLLSPHNVFHRNSSCVIPPMEGESEEETKSQIAEWSGTKWLLGPCTYCCLHECS